MSAGDRCDPLAKARQQVKPTGDPAPELIEIKTLDRRRQFEERHPTNMHVRIRRLDPQEARIDGRQARHDGILKLRVATGYVHGARTWPVILDGGTSAHLFTQ